MKGILENFVIVEIPPSQSPSFPFIPLIPNKPERKILLVGG
jgi:hypothetical protein